MVKTKFKKAVSLVLAAVMSLTAFMGIGATTAFAAVGEKADVYLVDYPRSGDTNNNGEWGHGNLNYMNGWKGLSTKYTGLRAMGSYSGNIAYCIEPGTGQRTGDTLTEKGENFFNNISPNGTISGDDIRLLIGRILQYGYRGGISTSWKSQNESDANCIAHAYATQILIWETIVGERDASFNHVSTGGYNAVLECVSSAHPLRSKILSYYNSMVSFDTLTDRQTYEVIAVFKTVVYTDSPESFKYYQFVNAETAEDFTAYVEKCKGLSLYDTGVTAEYGDKLLTLSTCEYSRTNGRLVVVAKLINE